MNQDGCNTPSTGRLQRLITTHQQLGKKNKHFMCFIRIHQSFKMHSNCVQQFHRVNTHKVQFLRLSQAAADDIGDKAIFCQLSGSHHQDTVYALIACYVSLWMCQRLSNISTMTLHVQYIKGNLYMQLGAWKWSIRISSIIVRFIWFLTHVNYFKKCLSQEEMVYCPFMPMPVQHPALGEAKYQHYNYKRLYNITDLFCLHKWG